MKQWTDTVLTVGGIKEFKFHYVQMKQIFEEGAMETFLGFKFHYVQMKQFVVHLKYYIFYHV